MTRDRAAAEGAPRPWPVMLSLALLLVAAPAAAARTGDLVGTWLSAKRTIAVALAPCDDGICGRIVWLADPLDDAGDLKRDAKNDDPALRGRPWCGLTVAQGLTANEDGAWTGRFYYPKHGRDYRVILRREGDALNMRAYIGAPILGRTEIWSLAEAELPGCPEPG